MTHRREAEILQLLARGLTNSEIGWQLGICRQSVGEVRRAHRIPNAPGSAQSLEEAWAARTLPVEGGHLEWLGERRPPSGIPILRHDGVAYTAARIAFRLQHGREPQGRVLADCGVAQCVAPGHVEDAPGRLRVREQLRFLDGRGVRPERCVRGHDQAVHGRYEASGTAYCQECKRERRRAAAERAAGRP